MSFFAERTSDMRPEFHLYGPERELLAEMRNLMNIVGELTVMLVVQGACLSALRNGRTQPDAGDVEDAIAQVADNVPDQVAEKLWDAREAIVARLQTESFAR